MKNKIILLLPVIIASLSSCNGGEKTSKVKLSYGSRYDTTATELTVSEFQNKVGNEESFLLALHPGAEEKVTCSCWKTFSGFIDEYVKDHDQIVYKADVFKLESYGLKAPVNQDPGFAIFENGKLKKQYIYTGKNTPTYFLNKDAFASFVEDISIAPSMIYINDNQYLEKITNKEDFKMSVVRKGCSDCSYMLPNVFDPFFKEHNVDEKLYLLDIEDLDHYHRSTDGEKVIYQAYKDSLFLSESTNPTYGYSTGVVPTTFVYEQGKIVDGNVFFNDEIGVKEDGKYYITNTYYTTERVAHLKYTSTVLKDKQLRDDEIADYNGFKYLPSSSASVYHTPILQEFLNHYFK